MTTLTPANTPGTAIDLGRLGDADGFFQRNVVSAGSVYFLTEVVTGSVGTASPLNTVWYKFNVTSFASTVAAQHMWVNAVFDAKNFQAILHDPTGTRLVDEWPDRDGDPDIRNPDPNEGEPNLAGGTYYIQVQNTGSPANYEFGLVAAPDPNYFNLHYHIPLGAGSTEGTAKNLGTLTSGTSETFQDALETLYNRTISNGVVTIDSTRPIVDNRTDFFEFRLPASGNLAVGYTFNGPYVNLILHEPAQGPLDVPHSQVLTNGQSIHLVQGGPYFLELDAYNVSVTGGGTNPVEARLPSENFQLYSLTLQFNQDTIVPTPTPTTPTPTAPAPTSPTPTVPSGGGGGGGGGSPSVFNGHSYEFMAFNGTAQTWAQAEAAAAAQGGYLATITSQAEDNFVAGLLAGQPSYAAAFIGASDAGHEGVWQWAVGPEAGTTFWQGSTVPGAYANWAAGEPNNQTNNSDGSENFGAIVPDGTWYDLPSLRDPSFTVGYIIEFNTTMATTPADIGLLDTATGQPVTVAATPYSGPVSGLQHQYVYTGSDNVNITVTDSNWFLKGGPGEDALQAFGGYNVLDGSTGSNFLTGGSGTDTFFVDDRSPPSDIWSTVNNFHQGDDATVFGIVNSPAIQWFDNQGATGFAGLTLHVFGQNAPTASLTLVGYSTADLSNGRLTVQFGNETDGTPFMHIIGTG